MSMLQEKISYHKAAGQFLKSYYENNSAENIFFSFGFLSEIAKEARHIAKSLELKDMEYQNSIVAAWFSFSAVSELCLETATKSGRLLNEFYSRVNYPEQERVVLENAIQAYNKNRYAETKLQKVVCDAINSRLARTNFVENIILLKEESNRLTKTDKSELFFLRYYLDQFLKRKYYTDYANENYSGQREKNFHLLEKRINKLEVTEKKLADDQPKEKNELTLNNKETEDLFKIAFRNYNHLVSVADAKASLLINVNSIIISFMLAFILGRIERYSFLLWPAVLLLSVCMTTILLSILASRPQKNIFFDKEKPLSYQRFFFGSFDLIDPSFRHVTWKEYAEQLTGLFSEAREIVYMEIYKESYNVRKVLSNKFRYLSQAYWVFIGGLVLSIIAFVVAIQSAPVVK
ncbi:Pycsar system effector family protein [Ferruginibacter profundus]